jgi:membrane associated rhomboid family serine protease
VSERPRPREKIFNIPPVVVAIVVVLLAIHGLRQLLPDARDFDVLRSFAFVPGRFTYAFDPDAVSAAFETVAKADVDRAEVARFFLGDGQPLWWTPLTYAFLHGNWSHVGLNSVWLVAFGAAVARRFGAWRFLAFCAVTAVAGALAHYVVHARDLEPVIGASATVSGAMAAAARFAFSFDPAARRGDDPHAGFRQPALTLPQMLADRRVVSFLGFWFLTNLLFGVAAQPLGITDAAVAWEAHIGGFLVGLFGFRWFDPPPKPSAQ